MIYIAGSAGVNHRRSGGGGETSRIRDTPSQRPPNAWTSLPSPESERCGWRGRSRPLPLPPPPPLPLLLLLSHAEHMVRDPRLLKSQRSCSDAAVWPPASLVLPSAAQSSEMGTREALLRAGVHTLASHPLGEVAEGTSRSPAVCTWTALRREHWFSTPLM